MANTVKSPFSGFASQLAVVCLLAVFIAIAIGAMYTTSGTRTDELSWIGMTVSPLRAGTAAALGIPNNVGGVIVEDVEGVATRSGLRNGDVLQGINGKPVRDMAGFSELTASAGLSKGGVQLVVNRRGMQMPILVQPPGWAMQTPGQAAPGGAAQVPQQTAPGGAAGNPAAIDRRWLGIEADALTPTQARALGLPAGVQGMLIDAVTTGSRAQQAGLVNNDVIVSVNGRPTDSATTLWNTLATLNGGVPLQFGVYRNGQLQTIALPTGSATLAGFGRSGWGCLGWGAGGAPVYPAPAATFPGGRGLGLGGTLLCPNCGARVASQRGVPGHSVPCPSCRTWMIQTQ